VGRSHGSKARAPPNAFEEARGSPARLVAGVETPIQRVSGEVRFDSAGRAWLSVTVLLLLAVPRPGPGERELQARVSGLQRWRAPGWRLEPPPSRSAPTRLPVHEVMAVAMIKRILLTTLGTPSLSAPARVAWPSTTPASGWRTTSASREQAVATEHRQGTVAFSLSRADAPAIRNQRLQSRMVESAGVEPAPESDPHEASPCLTASKVLSLPVLRRRRRTGGRPPSSRFPSEGGGGKPAGYAPSSGPATGAALARGAGRGSPLAFASLRPSARR